MKELLTLLDPQGIVRFTSGLLSSSDSLSSLDINSLIRTDFHFRLSFSGSNDFVRVERRSLSFCKGGKAKDRILSSVGDRGKSP